MTLTIPSSSVHAMADDEDTPEDPDFIPLLPAGSPILHLHRALSDVVHVSPPKKLTRNVPLNRQLERSLKACTKAVTTVRSAAEALPHLHASLCASDGTPVPVVSAWLQMANILITTPEAAVASVKAYPAVAASEQPVVDLLRRLSEYFQLQADELAAYREVDQRQAIADAAFDKLRERNDPDADKALEQFKKMTSSLKIG